jgi:hypothetical protein
MKIAIIKENLKKKAAPLQIIHDKEDLSNQNPVVS